jgi:large subunit ribosomal protein L17
MRHRVAGRRLSRTSEHRVALRRNMVSSLFEHETISTTIQKAKEVKPFAEKLITLAKKGTLAHRRRAISLLGNRAIFVEEDGQMVKKGTVVGKLFSEIGPRYLERAGGYTRIIQMPLRRLGDNGQLVILQLVGENDKRVKKSKASKKVKALDKKADPVAEEATDAVVATDEEAQAPEEQPAEAAPEADTSAEEEKE